ncbi:hypothetical protein MN608_09751 [Microdochium nivale]|nr:hypothetical protein MN608_09751 [Microdochium nivale]
MSQKTTEQCPLRRLFVMTKSAARLILRLTSYFQALGCQSPETNMMLVEIFSPIINCRIPLVLCKEITCLLFSSATNRPYIRPDLKHRSHSGSKTVVTRSNNDSHLIQQFTFPSVFQGSGSGHHSTNSLLATTRP